MVFPENQCKDMLLIDSHLDLSWNALNWNRDLTQSVAEIRRSEAGMTDKARGLNTVAFPEMRQAEMVICLATVLARVSSLGEALLDYRTREIACAMARGQLAYYRIAEEQGILRMLRDWRSVASHLEEWRRDPRGSTPGTVPMEFDGRSQGSAAPSSSERSDSSRSSKSPEKAGNGPCPLGFIFSMEGADPILRPSSASEWWEDGLRVVGLAHYGLSAYAHGTGSEGGLTAAGRDLLRAMQEVGMVLDVTHLADQSFWEAVEAFKGPVLASHNNCRSLVPGDRQFSDEQIRYLIGRGSVIGAVCDVWMLYPGWEAGRTPNSVVTLSAVADHIDHVCQLAGNSLHSAIGSDLDGGYGTEQSPCDLNTIADLQKIPNLLAQRGYKDEDIENIMHGNWLRFFQSAWAGGMA
jgi:membrane dipeptidase